MEKYRVTKESMEYKGRVLRRIEHIVTQEKGGWIESELNLSQEGTCMVWDNAKVYGNARIADEVIVRGNAEVYEDAFIYGRAVIEGNAQIYAEAEIGDDAQVYADAQVYGKAKLCGDTKVYGDAEVFGETVIKDNKRMYGDVEIEKSSRETRNEYHSWDDIYSFATFNLFIQRGESMNTANLYANGRHQVQIEVLLEAKDRNGQYILIAPEEIFKNVKLVNYRNESFDGVLDISDEPGDYVMPLLRQVERASILSYGTFYISTDRNLGPINICISTLINSLDDYGNPIQVEYTTAEVNRPPNSNGNPRYVTVNVVPKRVFNELNIHCIEYEEEVPPNTKLKQYYVNFKSDSGARLHQVLIRPDYVFSLVLVKKAVTNGILATYYHYDYYYYSTTDSLFHDDQHLKYKLSLRPRENQGITIETKNHRLPGVCIWRFDFKYIEYWADSLETFDSTFEFSMFDSYGNEARIKCKILNNKELGFVVI